MSNFHHLLINNLIASITNFTVWFAVTFWVFLETKSVFATGMIAGLYLVLTAALAIWFGSLVDHHRKTRVMMVSSAASLLLYALSLAGYFLAPEGNMTKVAAVPLWLFLFAVIGLAGLPPALAGTFAKVVILELLASSALWLAVIVAAGAVLGLAYYLPLARTLFLGRETPGEPALPKGRFAIALVAVGLALLAVTLAPQVVLEFTSVSR